MAPSRTLTLQRMAAAGALVHAASRRSYMVTGSRLYADQSRLPTVASPSFWTSLIPRFLRKPTTEAEAAARATRKDAAAEEKRTGLIFLLLGILVGSNAINIIGLKREMLNFSRQTDAKLELLREVIERVKRGEDVNVKKALGTGDPEQEREWEEVIQELERTDMLWQNRKKRDAKRAEKAEQAQSREEEREHSNQTAQDKNAKSSPKFLM
ncbi:hypothetical protein CKM354_000275200 [Cercospora kikuchii]|uniref:Uncharacterized protein n=1 Tax=Cercospora kikuchii TaxID=84275 RepID=A0A9P3CFB3_9PEZI|nr:uncharacterized protein CKM354_000275200 [Cercospora kikuchii]GIZ39365.1 hypothetical protein CKM354_000275200 [Cercospora kikuchii]